MTALSRAIMGLSSDSIVALCRGLVWQGKILSYRAGHHYVAWPWVITRIKLASTPSSLILSTVIVAVRCFKGSALRWAWSCIAGVVSPCYCTNSLILPMMIVALRSAFMAQHWAGLGLASLALFPLLQRPQQSDCSVKKIQAFVQWHLLLLPVSPCFRDHDAGDLDPLGLSWLHQENAIEKALQGHKDIHQNSACIID